MSSYLGHEIHRVPEWRQREILAKPDWHEQLFWFVAEEVKILARDREEALRADIQRIVEMASHLANEAGNPGVAMPDGHSEWDRGYQDGVEEGIRRERARRNPDTLSERMRSVTCFDDPGTMPVLWPSLRDYFAGLAMQTLVAGYGSPQEFTREIAQLAYIVADTMLEERSACA